ncbi:hypothetical protein KY348_01820 [Candidatus Woesearchaeota archaeon]|nr:hypothetical protein [Candidatus Woesearchaeota archaeon]
MIKIQEKEGGIEFDTGYFYIFYCKKGDDEWVTIGEKSHPSDENYALHGFLLTDVDCEGEMIGSQKRRAQEAIKETLDIIINENYRVSEKEKEDCRFCGFEPPTDEDNLYKILYWLYLKLDEYSNFVVGL